MFAYLLVNLDAVFFTGVLVGALAATLACRFVGARRRKRAEDRNKEYDRAIFMAGLSNWPRAGDTWSYDQVDAAIKKAKGDRMTNPFDIKAVAAALGDHLAAGGAPIAQDLLESGLAKILPAFQAMAQSGEQAALDNIDALADKLLTRIISELPPAIRKELVGLKITNTTIIEQENKSA